MGARIRRAGISVAEVSKGGSVRQLLSAEVAELERKSGPRCAEDERAEREIGLVVSRSPSRSDERPKGHDRVA